MEVTTVKNSSIYTKFNCNKPKFNHQDLGTGQVKDLGSGQVKDTIVVKNINSDYLVKDRCVVPASACVITASNFDCPTANQTHEKNMQ